MCMYLLLFVGLVWVVDEGHKEVLLLYYDGNEVKMKCAGKGT